LKLPDQWPEDGRIQLDRLDCQAVDYLAIDSHAEYLAARDRLGVSFQQQHALSEFLLAGQGPPTVVGHCAACGVRRDFSVADEETYPAFRQAPNWRETLACSECGLINRLRASVEAFGKLSRGGPDGCIYLTERVTPLYEWMKDRHPTVVGSEYFGDDHESGASYELAETQVRHEDVTQLSFLPAQIAHVLTFDVLEHVPDYRAAVKEFYRVMKPGGSLLLSAPFNMELPQTLVRASVQPDGSVIHHETPEYHGDPVLSDQGVLCYYHFGWDLLDSLRDVGFERVNTLVYWKPDSAYLGWLGNLVVAHKPEL
jgi:hypothetical protein